MRDMVALLVVFIVINFLTSSPLELNVPAMTGKETRT